MRSSLCLRRRKRSGCGGNDLYISYRQQDGTWSKGYNLGPKVNTAAEELGPRISPDGKYLFFHQCLLIFVPARRVRQGTSRTHVQALGDSVQGHG
jgi:hypothetical protein